MKHHIETNERNTVYLEVDPRGESESYLPYMFVAYNNLTGRQAWYEGLRKDRTQLLDKYRIAVEAALDLT